MPSWIWGRLSLPLLELPVDVGIPHDGTGNELGEQHHKGAEVDDIAFCLDLAQIHINGIGHGLEGIEADTQRQYKANGGKAETKQRIEIAHKEVGVLEESQHTEIEHYGIDQSQPTDQLIIPMGFDQTGGGIVHHNGCDHDREVLCFTPGIENQAQDEQGEILEPLGNQIVDGKGCRHKPEEKQNTAENHSF